MPASRVLMRKIRQTLQLLLEAKLTQRQVSSALVFPNPPSPTSRAMRVLRPLIGPPPTTSATTSWRLGCTAPLSPRRAATWSLTTATF